MRLTRLLRADSYFPGLWDLRRDSAARRHWQRMFALQLDDMLRIVRERRGEPGVGRAEEARARVLAALARDPPPAHVHAWTLLRERTLDEVGLEDPYREVKAEDNEKALAQLPALLATLRGRGLRGALAACFAGNLFDLGSAATAAAHRDDRLRFEDHRRRLEEALGRTTNAGRFAARLRSLEPARAVVLVDNAGADFVLGVIPLALELLRAGITVTLGANQRAALNDVTCDEAAALLVRLAGLDAELETALGNGAISLVSTGTGSPGIDLHEVGVDLDRAINHAGLLILIGQGRAIETNWRTCLDLPVVRLATVKDGLVAGVLGVSLYDAVCDDRSAGEEAASQASGASSAVPA